MFTIFGGIVGIILGASKESREQGGNPAQGCLSGALTGAAGGAGCLAAIIEFILPLVLGFLLFSWLLNGCDWCSKEVKIVSLFIQYFVIF